MTADATRRTEGAGPAGSATLATATELAAVADAVIRAHRELLTATAGLRDLLAGHESSATILDRASAADEAVIALEADLLDLAAGAAHDIGPPPQLGQLPS